MTIIEMTIGVVIATIVILIALPIVTEGPRDSSCRPDNTSIRSTDSDSSNRNNGQP